MSQQIKQAKIAVPGSCNVDLTVFYMNNSALGLIKKIQNKHYGKHYVECDEPKLDFAKLAVAYGGNGLKLDLSDDVESVVKKALSFTTPTIVDCRISDKEF